MYINHHSNKTHDKFCLVHNFTSAYFCLFFEDPSTSFHSTTHTHTLFAVLTLQCMLFTSKTVLEMEKKKKKNRATRDYMMRRAYKSMSTK